MTLSHSLGMDITMAPDGSPNHTDLCDPGSSMTLEHQHGLRCWPRLQAWPSVATGTTDINTKPDCSRAMDHMGLGSSPGPKFTQALGGKQTTHVSQFPTALDSSDLPSPHYMNLSGSLSPIFPPYTCLP